MKKEKGKAQLRPKSLPLSLAFGDITAFRQKI